jgi:esterase/lipase
MKNNASKFTTRQQMAGIDELQVMTCSTASVLSCWLAESFSVKMLLCCCAWKGSLQ